MTPEQIKEIEDRVNAATPGPWKRSDDCSQIYIGWGKIEIKDVDDEIGNCKFITRAREDIPALIAEVRRLNALLSQAVPVLPVDEGADSRIDNLVSANRLKDIFYVDASNTLVVPGEIAPSQSLEIKSDKKPSWDYDDELRAHICHYSPRSDYRLVVYLMQIDRYCAYSAEVEWSFARIDRIIGEFYDLDEAQEAAIEWAKKYEEQE